MSFQDKLRQYREQAGYKQAKDFAKEIGIPYQTYLNYENKGTEPKYDTLCQIATALGVTTDELLGHSLDEFERCKKLIYPLFEVCTGENCKILDEIQHVDGKDRMIAFSGTAFTLPADEIDKMTKRSKTCLMQQKDNPDVVFLISNKVISGKIQGRRCMAKKLPREEFIQLVHKAEKSALAGTPSIFKELYLDKLFNQVYLFPNTDEFTHRYD